MTLKNAKKLITIKLGLKDLAAAMMWRLNLIQEEVYDRILTSSRGTTLDQIRELTLSETGVVIIFLLIEAVYPKPRNEFKVVVGPLSANDNPRLGNQREGFPPVK